MASVCLSGELRGGVIHPNSLSTALTLWGHAALFNFPFTPSPPPSLSLIWQAHSGGSLVGVIIGKQEQRRSRQRGYVAMLVVESSFRRYGVGSALASISLAKMAETCDEVREAGE